jgi:hypothetical protein
LALLLYISFPLLCILAMPQSSRPGDFAERMVFGIALYEVLLLAIGLPLGLTGYLVPRNYAMLSCCAAIPLAVLSWRNGIRFSLTPLRRWLGTRGGKAALLLAVLLGCTFTLEVGFDALFGTMHYDGLWYHIPRVIFWQQQGSFDAWPTPMWGHVGLPVAADVILGQNILLGNGWRGVGFVTCLLSVGAIACVYLRTPPGSRKRFRFSTSLPFAVSGCATSGGVSSRSGSAGRMTGECCSMGRRSARKEMTTTC